MFGRNRQISRSVVSGQLSLLSGVFFCIPGSMIGVGIRLYSYGRFPKRTFSYKIPFLLDISLPDTSQKKCHSYGNFLSEANSYIVLKFSTVVKGNDQVSMFIFYVL